MANPFFIMVTSSKTVVFLPCS